MRCGRWAEGRALPAIFSRKVDQTPSAAMTAAAGTTSMLPGFWMRTSSPSACGRNCGTVAPSSRVMLEFEATAAARIACRSARWKNAIGEIVALAEGRAGNRGDDGSARGAPDFDRFRLDRGLGDARIQSEFSQHAAGVGRNLDAGAGFAQPIGTLGDDDAKSGGGERQRGGEAADASADNDDRLPFAALSLGDGRHGPLRSGRALAEEVAGGIGLGRAEAGAIAVERRAVGADLLVGVAHVDIRRAGDRRAARRRRT